MLKKLLENIKNYFIVYIRAYKRKNEGIRIFSIDTYTPGRIIVSIAELKRQEQYILNNKLNEKDAYEYRRSEVSKYCNNIRKKLIRNVEEL